MSCTMTSHKEIFLTMCDSQLQAAFEECGMDAEYYAKRACPVDLNDPLKMVHRSTYKRLYEGVEHETRIRRACKRNFEDKNQRGSNAFF